jgi:hypothetical protein
MDHNESKLVAHEALAALIAGASVVGASLAGPIGGPLVELGSATVTAGLAAHAVLQDECAHANSLGLRKAARDAVKRPGAPLAAYAMDVACRVHAHDPRALRSTAMMIGRCASGRAASPLWAWVADLWAPLRAARTAVGAVDAAFDGARFVRDLRRAASEVPAREPVVIGPEDGLRAACAANDPQQADVSNSEVAA